MEQRIESGGEEMGAVFAGLFDLAMGIERERVLRAGHYERTPERRDDANATKPKTLDPPGRDRDVARAQDRRPWRALLSAGPGARPALLPAPSC